uniref:CIDE-N domain-containing protein n=2 Tax=Arion vulgaris TaxID=1028688 RepID=A0A0B7BI66_9EUPU
MAEAARPFKIWNYDRSVKKSLTASSLQELLEKGCSKLNLNHSSALLRVVLEEDGTEVDDDDYFALVPDNSTLLILQDNEKWSPQGSGTIDETDSRGDVSHDQSELKHLAEYLKHDLLSIITFNSEQQQLLVDSDTSTLAHLMGRTERYARGVQASCQCHLDELARDKETMDILKLYHHARSASEQQPADKKKET